MLIHRIDDRAMQLAVWVALSVVPYALLLLPGWWDWLGLASRDRFGYMFFSPIAYLFFFQSTMTFFFKDDLTLFLVHAVSAFVMFWAAAVISLLSIFILWPIMSGIDELYRLPSGAELVLLLSPLSGAASVGLCLYWLQRSVLGPVGRLVGRRARLLHAGACALPALLLMWLVWHDLISTTMVQADRGISEDWHLWGLLTLAATIHATITGVAHLLVPEKINQRPADPATAEG